jgi:chromosome condensin MukBEF complex kleisin-like MukF subunit
LAHEHLRRANAAGDELGRAPAAFPKDHYAELKYQAFEIMQIGDLSQLMK